MIIDQDSLTFIHRVLKTAKIAGIENVIIEPNRVRATNDEQTIVMLQTDDIPVLACGSIGLNRIDVFTSRFNIAQSFDNVDVEAVTESVDDEDGPVKFVRSITMKNSGSKIEYRCANPKTIRAPKKFNQEMAFATLMTPETVAYITQGVGAMGASEVTFIGSKDGAFFSMTDVNGDTFASKFASNVKVLTKQEDFEYEYPAKVILSLFKANPTGWFHISEKGTLKIVVDGFDMYVLTRN